MRLFNYIVFLSFMAISHHACSQFMYFKGNGFSDEELKQYAKRIADPLDSLDLNVYSETYYVFDKLSDPQKEVRAFYYPLVLKMLPKIKKETWLMHLASNYTTYMYAQKCEFFTKYYLLTSEQKRIITDLVVIDLAVGGADLDGGSTTTSEFDRIKKYCAEACNTINCGRVLDEWKVELVKKAKVYRTIRQEEEYNEQNSFRKCWEIRNSLN